VKYLLTGFWVLSFTIYADSTVEDKLKLNGGIDIEYYHGKNFAGEYSSDIIASEITLGATYSINSITSAEVEVIYEEPGNVSVDKGIIKLENEDKNLYLVTGHKIIDFGTYESNFISDSLPLTIGETHESVLEIGTRLNNFSLNGYAYEGDKKLNKQNSLVRDFGLNAGFNFGNDNFTAMVKIGYISDFGDLATIEDALATSYNKEVDGFAYSAKLDLNKIQFIAEYLQSSSFHNDDLVFKDRGAKISTYQLELSLKQEIMSKSFTFMSGYQGSKEAVAITLPKSKFLVGISSEIAEGTSVTAEYSKGKDYAMSDGGTGNNDQTITLALVAGF